MLRHWIETITYDEQDKLYQVMRKEIPKSIIEKIKNGEITHSSGDKGKYFFYKKCVGYCFFDTEEDGDRKNETGWTFFYEKLCEAKKKLGWIPKITDEDDVI